MPQNCRDTRLAGRYRGMRDTWKSRSSSGRGSAPRLLLLGCAINDLPSGLSPAVPHAPMREVVHHAIVVVTGFGRDLDVQQLADVREDLLLCVRLEGHHHLTHRSLMPQNIAANARFVSTPSQSAGGAV